jgi:hypothetical protein
MSRGCLLAAALAFATAGCNWGFFHRSDAPVSPQPEPEPIDTVAPALEARPAGGDFAAIQYVTLAADEPATVRYTLDGSDPQGAGSAAAHVAPSPVFWLRMAAGTTTLRAVAVDAAGNVSAPVQQTYVVTVPAPDTTPPLLTLLAAPAGPVPLLGGAPLRWTSDEDVTWVLEVGGGGVPGFGTRAASGTAAAGEPVASAIPGCAFPGLAPAAAWIHATDRSGLRSSLEVPAVTPAPPVAGPTIAAGGCGDAVVEPGGARAWLASWDPGVYGVVALDVDPASSTYETVLASYPLHDGLPAALGVSPDGALLYVGARSATVSLTMLATADGTWAGGSSLLPSVDRLAVSPDGARIWIASNQVLYEMGLSGGAASQLPDYVGLSSAGGLLAALGGRRLVAGGQVVDVDPASPDRGRVRGALTLPAGGQPVLSPDGARVYYAACPADCTFSVHDPGDLSTLAARTVPAPPGGTSLSLAATPDHLLALSSAGRLLVFRADDLSPLASVSLPLGAVIEVVRVVLTPDFTRAYAAVFTQGGTCQVIRLPLH